MDAGHVAWARGEFGGAMLGDVRHVRRLQSMAARLASNPAGTVAGAFRNRREARAGYEFLAHREIDWRDIAAASHEACARRCAGLSEIIVPIDGSSWSLTDWARCKGTGPVGSLAHGGQGIKVMTAYALSSEGIPLGILAQSLWARPQKPNPIPHAKRVLSDKESRHWTELQTKCEERFVGSNSRPRLWFQMDREADQVSVLLRSIEPGVLLTVRADHNRNLSAKRSDRSPLKLAEVLEHARMRGTLEIRVPRSRKHGARSASLSASFASVSLQLRSQWTHRDLANAPVTVVHVREVGETEHEPIEWVLYTTYRVKTLEDALKVVRAYALRWRIERLHYTTKTGACDLEDSQLRSFDAFAKWITLQSAVASRLQHILYRSRDDAEVAATEEFSRDEIEATLLLREKEDGNTFPAGRTPSLRQLVLFIAHLGGYMGYANSPPPGIKVFERGFLRVEAAALIVSVLRDRPPHGRPPSGTDGSNA